MNSSQTLIILIEEARKNFDLVEEEALRQFHQAKSYLYILLFLFTSLFSLYTLTPLTVLSLKGIIFNLSFILAICSSIFTLRLLEPPEYFSNPSITYLLFSSKRTKSSDNFFMKVLYSYEKIITYNRRLNKTNSFYLKIAFKLLILSIILLILSSLLLL